MGAVALTAACGPSYGGASTPRRPLAPVMAATGAVVAAADDGARHDRRRRPGTDGLRVRQRHRHPVDLRRRVRDGLAAGARARHRAGEPAGRVRAAGLDDARRRRQAADGGRTPGLHVLGRQRARARPTATASPSTAACGPPCPRPDPRSARARPPPPPPPATDAHRTPDAATLEETSMTTTPRRSGPDRHTAAGSDHPRRAHRPGHRREHSLVRRADRLRARPRRGHRPVPACGLRRRRDAAGAALVPRGHRRPALLAATPRPGPRRLRLRGPRRAHRLGAPADGHGRAARRDRRRPLRVGAVVQGPRRAAAGGVLPAGGLTGTDLGRTASWGGTIAP